MAAVQAAAVGADCIVNLAVVRPHRQLGDPAPTAARNGSVPRPVLPLTHRSFALFLFSHRIHLCIAFTSYSLHDALFLFLIHSVHSRLLSVCSVDVYDMTFFHDMTT